MSTDTDDIRCGYCGLLVASSNEHVYQNAQGDYELDCPDVEALLQLEKEIDMKSEEAVELMNERTANLRRRTINKVERLAEEASRVGLVWLAEQLGRLVLGLEIPSSLPSRPMPPSIVEDGDTAMAHEPIDHFAAGPSREVLDFEAAMAHVAPGESTMQFFVEQVRQHAYNAETHGHYSPAQALFSISNALNAARQRLDDLETRVPSPVGVIGSTMGFPIPAEEIHLLMKVADGHGSYSDAIGQVRRWLKYNGIETAD